MSTRPIFEWLCHMINESPPVSPEGDAFARGTFDLLEAMADNHMDVGSLVTTTGASTSTPNPISDNPLDAPEAPRPEGEAEDYGDGAEDVDMADAEEVEQKEVDEVEKDALPTADGVGDDHPLQSKASLESSARQNLINASHTVILPSYSAWFDMREINTIEKKALPEFFNERNRSKTPAVYKDYRDFMINTYRLNPSEYLTVTACRRNLAGDVCAIMRVHAFLEQWGLINYQVGNMYDKHERASNKAMIQVDADTRPSNIGPPFTGHFRVIADTPRGLQPLQPAPHSTTPGRPHAATERLRKVETTAGSNLNLSIRRNIYEQSGKEVTPASESKAQPPNGAAAEDGTPTADAQPLEESLKEPTKKYFCYECGQDCTRVRWHNSKAAQKGTVAATAREAKLDICPRCYSSARFPSNTSRSDYIMMESETYNAVPDKDAPWTDTELLLLLEALEMDETNEDWNAIAQHVGTRTREQCVLKFLQLEIEDPYLESEPPVKSENDGVAPGIGHTSNNLAWLSGGRVPFSQSDNPAMSTLAFMAGNANQDVIAAAMGKSAEEIRRNLSKTLQGADPAPPGVGEQGTAAAGAASTAQSAETVKVEGEEDTDTVRADSRSNTQPSRIIKPSVADVALTAAGYRAAALASHEERQITRLISSAVNLQLQKLELKLTQFGEMERLLEAERRDLERRRKQLFLERVGFSRRVEELEGRMRGLGMGGGGVAAGGLGDSAGRARKMGFDNPGRDDVRPVSEEDPSFRSYDI